MNSKSIISKTSSLLIYLILFLNFSFWLISEMNTMVRYILILAASILIFLIRKKTRINSTVFVAFIFILSMQLVSAVVMGGYMGVSTGLYVTTLTAFLFVNAVDENEFSKAFRNFMIIECICALATYFLYMLVPQMFNIFPTITTWRQGRILFKNLYVSVLPVSMGQYYRNFGIFVEPGMHAILISLAMLDELFHRPSNVKVLLLYIITIITTISTSGVLAVAALMFVFIWNRSQSGEYYHNSAIKRRIILAFLLGIIVFVVLYQNGFITSYIFEKLSSNDTVSGYERRKGYEIMLREFINNPILGMGLKKAIGTYYVELNVTMTATVLNWFGTYGIFYGLVCFWGVASYSIGNLKGNLLKLMIAAAVTVILFSQDFSRELIMFIFIFYGYKAKKGYVFRK